MAQNPSEAIFQYQTMVCELTGMEVSNASMYDGASAAAEAASPPASATRRNRILWGGNVNPQTRDVLRTYCWSRKLEHTELPAGNGRIDAKALENALAEGGAAALVVQSPNFFGTIEDLKSLAEAVHGAGALLIVSTDLLALGLLEAPGKLGADIVVGDGQSVGNAMSFGGPAFGFIAVNKPLMRKMPGRICGQTVDAKGRRTFVLTLQAGQHIRREKATSNICSNQEPCTCRVGLPQLIPCGPGRLANSLARLNTPSGSSKNGKFGDLPRTLFRETVLLCGIVAERNASGR